MNPSPVLFVDHATALGGAEHSLVLLFEHLDRSQFASHLATPAGTLAHAARQRGVIVHELPLPRLRREPAAAGRLVLGARALARLIRRERIALIHANTVRAGPYAALAALATGRPFIWHVRDLLSSRLYARILCAACTRAVAVSRATAAPLPCSQKVRVVYCGIRPDDFPRSDPDSARTLRDAWGVPRTASLIGQVARLQPWKGQAHLIDAAERVIRELPNVYFIIVGGDIFGDASAYEKQLREIVRQRGLMERVLFAGHRSDIPAVLGALDVLAHASDAEPFGRILIEAGAAALPVVAYASGGVPEIVIDGETGVLVTPGNSEDLARSLCRILRDPSAARKMGERARTHVLDRFAVAPLTRELEEVFRQALAK